MSMNQQGRYHDRVAVITGAASGLGEAAARLLVAEGGRVIIADYGAERGEAVAASLGSAAKFLRCDVTNEGDVAAAMDLAVASWGRLDGAFANAGIVGVIGPIEQTTMDDFDRTMAVLVRGVFVTVKHAARQMIACGNGGAIVAGVGLLALAAILASQHHHRHYHDGWYNRDGARYGNGYNQGYGNQYQGYGNGYGNGYGGYDHR